MNATLLQPINFPQTKADLLSPLANPNGHSKRLWENILISTEKQIFFYRLILKTVEACRSGRYTDFDAHTTSNCCHGIAVFAKDLLLLVNQLNLYDIEQQTQQRCELLKRGLFCERSPIEWLPGPLIDLASLYALSFIGILDSYKGRRTNNLKLREISPVPNRFCVDLRYDIQKFFSNLIADSYGLYLNVLDKKTEISGAPIGFWGKYVGKSYLRSDKRQIKYASSMFSMQIALAYLIYSRSKIALVNDLMSKLEKVKGRYIQIFEGDGVNQLNPLSLEEVKACNPQEPIVVFGACAFTDALNLKTLNILMKPWLYQFPRLIQAHEIHYPQFPSVSDDPAFDSSPILPQEIILKEIIANLSKIKGVAPQDPSFCCFTHIFPASTGQVLNVHQDIDEKALPLSFMYLPARFRNPCVIENY